MIALWCIVAHGGGIDRLCGIWCGNIFRMLWTIAIILVVLWLLGLVSAFTLGGFIHVLLVLAVIIVLIRLIRGENIV